MQTLIKLLARLKATPGGVLGWLTLLLEIGKFVYAIFKTDEASKTAKERMAAKTKALKELRENGNAFYYEQLYAHSLQQLAETQISEDSKSNSHFPYKPPPESNGTEKQ